MYFIRFNSYVRENGYQGVSGHVKFSFLRCNVMLLVVYFLWTLGYI